MIVGVVLCSLLLIGGASGIAVAESSPNETSQQRDVIVIFEDETRINETAISELNGTITGGRSLEVLPALFVRIDNQSLDSLRNHPDVRRVEYDKEVETPPTYLSHRTATNDVVPWGIDRINATAAERDVPDSAEANVTVAVLDTGIDYDHRDLESNVVWGVDVVGPTEYGLDAADDIDGHGTHVAGTIAAKKNAIGVTGVAPNVKIYSIQVLGTNGGETSDIIQGIDQALRGPDGIIGTDDDADVISMSLGGEFGTVAEREVIKQATNESVPVIAAAGNSGDGDPSSDEVAYPAKYDDSIAVAATDLDDQVPIFSSSGTTVDIAAPGVNILSTYPGDRYIRFSGTSMSTGHVSGTVALMIAQDMRDGSKDLTVDDIKKQLSKTAVDIDPTGRDNLSGAGLVRADRVVEIAALHPEIAADERQVTAGDTVEFTVAWTGTGQQLSVIVQMQDTTYELDQNRSVRHTFDTAGVYTVKALIQTETGYEYPIQTTVTVSPGDVTGDDRIAMDPDKDGQFQDVNGDGVVSIVDVLALYKNLDNLVVQNNPDAFDFNQDGSVDIVDVLRLFNEVSEADS